MHCVCLLLDNMCLPSFGLPWFSVVVMTLHLIHCLTFLIQYLHVFLLFLLASPWLGAWHGGQTGYTICADHNTSQWGQNRPTRRGIGGFSKWSMLADEMVSLHRARTHWGLWGVRHIWANRLLMSCLHEPLIMAIEREASTRGFEVTICCGSALFGLAQDCRFKLLREQICLSAEMLSL